MSLSLQTMNVTNTYEITETISQHFLVDESAREELEDFLKQIKQKMDTMRTKVQSGLFRLKCLKNIVQYILCTLFFYSVIFQSCKVHNLSDSTGICQRLLTFENSSNQFDIPLFPG